MIRAFRLLVIAMVLAYGTVGAAQEATPEAEPLLAGLGYPELAITVSDDGVELPDQVTAGRTLIVYTNDSAESLHPFMLRLPGTLPIADAMADLGPEAMEPPDWFLDATFPGFVGETLPGKTTYAVVDLVVGTHLVLHDSAVAFEVVPSEATPVTSGDPPADATVRMFEMGYELPSSIAAGPQVWEVTNTGQVPHELLLLRSAVPITADQVIALFASEEGGATPVAGGPTFDDIEPVGGLGWLSPDTTAWTEVDLGDGTYAALCFVFDPATGQPHLMQGMVTVFTVGDGGATPAG